MSNKTDFFAGLILLFVCGLFAWQISLLPQPEGDHAFTPGSFPKGVVILLTLLSFRILYKSLKKGAAGSLWPEAPILHKVGKMALLMAAYILSFVYLGAWCYENGVPDGVAFSFTTGLFLFLAQCMTRPGKILFSAVISLVMTGTLFAIFYYLFKVQLP